MLPVSPGFVHERAVAHGDEPVGGGGDPGIVGDDDQGLPGFMEGVEQPEHLQGGLAVEVAGGFVGQDDERVVGQGTGDRDPLALAPGQRRRGARPVGQPTRSRRSKPAARRPEVSGRPAAPAVRRSRPR